MEKAEEVVWQEKSSALMRMALVLVTAVMLVMPVMLVMAVLAIHVQRLRTTLSRLC